MIRTLMEWVTVVGGVCTVVIMVGLLLWVMDSLKEKWMRYLTTCYVAKGKDCATVADLISGGIMQCNGNYKIKVRILNPSQGTRVLIYDVNNVMWIERDRALYMEIDERR